MYCLQTTPYCCVFHIVNSKLQIENKLAPYGTGGRLLLTANFKVT